MGYGHGHGKNYLGNGEIVHNRRKECLPPELHTAAQGAGVGLLRGLVRGERRDGLGTRS